jgi:AraC-like DNA-binding protein
MKMDTTTGRKYHSLSFRQSGEVTFLHNNKTLHSGKNSITFMPANTEYKTEIKSDSDMLLIHFTTNDEYQGLSPICIDVGYNKELENMFSELVDMYDSTRRRDYRCLSAFYKILATIENQILTPQKKLVPKRIRDAKNYITQNFNEKISIDTLANQAGISQALFRKEFKQYFGMSPLMYIKKIRIDNAKLLLRSGLYSVSEVATNCGFESISYFAHEFGRATEMTPSEYIKAKQ